MKKYMRPEMDFVKFSAEDVITTSGDSKLDGFKSPAVEDDTLKSLDEGYGDVFWNGMIQ